ncbi:MAG: hypothetical protein AMJ60_11340 [Desulfobacterales bacterium SG8_35]|nr:MAG: hypothetical protein AMJ60_11340 [Desulfobacterales bacterium SG8_35]
MQKVIKISKPFFYIGQHLLLSEQVQAPGESRKRNEAAGRAGCRKSFLLIFFLSDLEQEDTIYISFQALQLFPTYITKLNLVKYWLLME